MKKQQKLLPIMIITVIALIIIAYLVFALFFNHIKVAASEQDLPISKVTTSQIAWPSYGQSAVGVVGYGVLGQNGSTSSVPIASIAKTMLALSVLDKKPLDQGQTGPTVTMTQADVDLYHSYLAQGGSVAPVNVGERITEYQLLQALLLPSGDNIADTLANWAFGSVENYLNYANDKAASLGLAGTHFADAGGLSPQTVSTAYDLVILGEKAMENPVLAEVVNQAQASLPVAGVVRNYNSLLGQNNVVGIKTGNTPEAGGCLLFAQKISLSNQSFTLVGAILGATSRAKVLQDTSNFLASNNNIFALTTIAKAGQKVGFVDLPWGKSVDVLASKDIETITVKGESVSAKLSLLEISKAFSKGDQIGSVTLTAGQDTNTFPVTLANNIEMPSSFWKIFHP